MLTQLHCQSLHIDWPVQQHIGEGIASYSEEDRRHAHPKATLCILRMARSLLLIPSRKPGSGRMNLSGDASSS